MELLTNLEQQEENTNGTPVIYTAYGWVAGVFQPEKKKKKKMWGVLTTEDGQEFAATMDWFAQHNKNKSVPQIAGKSEVKSQQQSSRFTVQVNGQVFIEQSSVTLNRRVLCIDSKPVAQSKLVVVIGQPKTMQADGSVTSCGDRSVLISK